MAVADVPGDALHPLAIAYEGGSNRYDPPVSVRRSWVSLFVLCVCVGVSVSGCARHAAATGAASATVDDGSIPQRGALMLLTPSEGISGSTVTMLVTGCRLHGSTSNQITWQNFTQLMKEPGGAHLDVGGVTRSGNELRATFTVPASSPLGTSMFDATCAENRTEPSRRST